MRFPRKETISRLEYYFSSLLHGLPVEEWAEKLSLNLIKLSGQKNPPVKMERLFQLRNIKKDIIYKDNLPEPARLVITEEGFKIEMSIFNKRNECWNRFFLGHEIAHTLFYEIKNWPPVQIINLEPGNPDLEWLCSHISKCILLPSSWVINDIKNSPNIGSASFSLSILEHLERRYLVPWQIIAERIIRDLELWSCIILNLIYKKKRNEEKEERRWELKTHISPKKKVDNLFIPIGHYERGKKINPSVKGKFKKFIEEIINNQKGGNFIKLKTAIDIFNNSTTGNLGKILKEILKSDEINIYLAIKDIPTKKLFQLENQNEKPQSLIICLPLSH